MINKILFITLSNIGDVILTLPALDFLREEFPSAKITVIAGARPKEIFEDNPNINRLIVYNKHSKLKEKIKLFQELKQEKFDLVVDLRNSLFGAFLPAKYKTSPFLSLPKNMPHMKDRHLYRTQQALFGKAGKVQNFFNAGKAFFIKPEDTEYINAILKENNITSLDQALNCQELWDISNGITLCKKCHSH